MYAAIKLDANCIRTDVKVKRQIQKIYIFDENQY